MISDRYGMPLTTQSPNAVDAYVEGVDRILSMAPDAEGMLRESLLADPGLAVAEATLGLQLQLQQDQEGAREQTGRALSRIHGLTGREASFVNAIGALVAVGGARTGNRKVLRVFQEHVRDHPRDFLIVQQANNLTNNTGALDRQEQSFQLGESLIDVYGEDWAFLAMRAMSLQERDRFDEAREAAELSLGGNPHNALAMHPVAHIYYETNDHVEGGKVLGDWLETYEWSAPYHCHLAWHEALFDLMSGQYERALSILGRDIVPSPKASTFLLDAASLLWRFQIYDCAEQTLDWTPMRRTVETVAGNPGGAIAAAHGALFCAATNDEKLFSQLVDGLRGQAEKGHPIAGTIVLPLALGIHAFALGEYRECVDQMEPVMGDIAAIGGSNAQREVFADTFLQACIRGGHYEKAQELLRQRLARRSSARDYMWLGQCLDRLGDRQAGLTSIETADSLWSNAEPGSREQLLRSQLRAELSAAV